MSDRQQVLDIMCHMAWLRARVFAAYASTNDSAKTAELEHIVFELLRDMDTAECAMLGISVETMKGT